MFPAASYQYVLYGMGFRMAPEARGRALRDADAARDALDRTAGIKAKLARQMPSNRDLLNKLAQYRFQAI